MLNVVDCGLAFVIEFVVEPPLPHAVVRPAPAKQSTRANTRALVNICLINLLIDVRSVLEIVRVQSRAAMKVKPRNVQRHVPKATVRTCSKIA